MEWLFMKDELFDKKEIRYESLKKAIDRLQEAINMDVNVEDVKIDAVIQRFEFTFELLWKTLKDYIEYVGIYSFENSPKTVLKTAFKAGILSNEESYIDMLKARNSTTHLYDENIAKTIYFDIVNKYVKAIKDVIEYLENHEYLK